MSSFEAPDEAERLPPVDARLAPPETRFEVLDGELVYVSPANIPHGTRHSKIAALMEAHVGAAFEVAVDLLTRTSKTSDVAPNVSVFPDAPDPVTGGRQLEQLAFEVVSKQSLAYAGRKAAKLVARGVRGVFAIDIGRGRALEWSAASAAWVALGPRSRIADAALEVPLPIAALLSAAKADDAMAGALLAKRNPRLVAFGSRREAKGKRKGVAEGERKGLAEGKREGLAEGERQGLAKGKREGLAEGERKGLARGKREGLAEGERKGLARGKRVGLAEGERKGLARGKRVGSAKARAEAVVTVLTTRGVVIAAAERRRILGERDPGRLTRWVARAVTCVTVDELFTEP